MVSPDLPKWRLTERNLKVGDLGHVRYEQKLGYNVWRLARVAAADPDDDGCVRTVMVEFRPRNVKDRSKAKEPVSMEICAQRFAVLLPIEDQEEVTTTILDHDDARQELGESHPQSTEMSLN